MDLHREKLQPCGFNACSVPSRAAIQAELPGPAKGSPKRKHGKAILGTGTIAVHHCKGLEGKQTHNGLLGNKTLFLLDFWSNFSWSLLAQKLDLQQI